MVHSLIEVEDPGMIVETGASVWNDRLASRPTPGPELEELPDERYKGGGEYTFTDGQSTGGGEPAGGDGEPIDGEPTGGGTEVTAATFKNRLREQWMTIDLTGINMNTTAEEGGGMSASASTDGNAVSSGVFWMKTDNGKPAWEDITREFVTVTTTYDESGASSTPTTSDPFLVIIEKGHTTSALNKVIADAGATVMVVAAPAPPLRVEFKSLDPYLEGFDPPLNGDIHTPTGARDKDDWVAWTSVARSGGYNNNTKVKLVFPDARTAQEFELAVANDSLQIITVPPTQLSAAETNLTIHGLPGNTIETATIEVRAKGTTNVVARLRVLALPERNAIGTRDRLIIVLAWSPCGGWDATCAKPG